ncbi:MAG: hypothetical protein HQM15_08265 [Deltaproteobacteria bacterium]|nr:hypothetical protein [Deltaproteobacteria bacterium]
MSWAGENGVRHWNRITQEVKAFGKSIATTLQDRRGLPLMAGLGGLITILHPGVAEAATHTLAANHGVWGLLGLTALLGSVFGNHRSDWGISIPERGCLEMEDWKITAGSLQFGENRFQIYSQGFILGMDCCNTVVQKYSPGFVNRWENLSSLMIDAQFRYMASPGIYRFLQGGRYLYVKLEEPASRIFLFSRASFENPHPHASEQAPVLPRPTVPPVAPPPASAPARPSRKGIGFVVRPPEKGLASVFDLLDPRRIFLSCAAEQQRVWGLLTPQQRELVFRTEDPSSLRVQALTPGERRNIPVEERTRIADVAERVKLWEGLTPEQQAMVLAWRACWAGLPERHFIREILSAVKIVSFSHMIRDMAGSTGRERCYQIYSEGPPLLLLLAGNRRVCLEPGEGSRRHLGIAGEEVQIFYDRERPLRVTVRL